MKYCIHCGSEMSHEAEFCEKCGKAVKKVSGEKATKKPLIIGCSIGIVLVSIIVVSLFATGVFEGKDETVQTSADVKPTQTVSDAENTTKEAGLYDSNGKMIKTWEELQLEEFIDLDDGGLYSSTETRTLQGQLVIKEGVTSIGDSAFCECSSLTSIAIPDSVTSIEDSVFSGCSSLISIAIPDGVTSIGVYAFRDVPLVLYDGNRTWDWGLSGVESVEKSDGTVLYP